MKFILFSIIIFLLSFESLSQIDIKTGNNIITGTDFYKQTDSYSWKSRDSIAMDLILAGNIPTFYKKFIPVKSSIETAEGKIINATYYVAPDYLMIGTDDDWARIPLTPMSAQKIADDFNCFLPTTKMVDQIYLQSKIKLEPVPMYAFRDSTVTMWQHHLIIEGQRKGRTGLISGIKKDVVISSSLNQHPKLNRVAIYGWHKLDGKPIQQLYTGHVNWYVDYSHGIRLISRKILVDGNILDYKVVLGDSVLKKLISDEEEVTFFNY